MPKGNFENCVNHFDSIGNVGLDDVASLATDDSKRTFQLADYEQVLLRSMLAVCSLASDGGDAEAYCLQAQSKAHQLGQANPMSRESEPEASGNSVSVALAPYLHGALREATHRNYDDALRSFQLVSAIEPDFLPVAEDIARAGEGVHSRSGNGVLYVIAFVGEGPQLVESFAPTTSQSLQIASTLIRNVKVANKQEDDSDDEKIVLPTIAKAKVPQVCIPPSRIAAVGVSVAKQPGDPSTMLGATQPLTDIGRLASERLEAEMPWIIGRAIARRALKEASVATASNSIGLQGNAASIVEFAAVNAWCASEQADIRCWSLLPREFQVLRAELPVGEHAIQLASLMPTGQPISPAQNQPVSIVDGRNSFLFVFAPEDIVSVVAPSR